MIQSYTIKKPIVPVPRKKSIFQCEGFDEYIYGWKIISFIKAAQKYSSYDITDIKSEIEKKRQWFQKTYPEHYRLEVPDDNLLGGKVLLMVINRQFKAKLLYRIPLTSVVGFKPTLNTLKSTRSKSGSPHGLVGSNPTVSASRLSLNEIRVQSSAFSFS